MMMDDDDVVVVNNDNNNDDDGDGGDTLDNKFVEMSMCLEMKHTEVTKTKFTTIISNPTNQRTNDTSQTVVTRS